METWILSTALILVAMGMVITNLTILKLRQKLDSQQTQISSLGRLYEDLKKHWFNMERKFDEVQKNAPAEVARCPQCEQLVPRRELESDYICHSCRGI
jgi:predicted RNase H-like nuclease (RuvC/YqgF family)